MHNRVKFVINKKLFIKKNNFVKINNYNKINNKNNFYGSSTRKFSSLSIKQPNNPFNLLFIISATCGFLFSISKLKNKK